MTKKKSWKTTMFGAILAGALWAHQAEVVNPKTTAGQALAAVAAVAAMLGLNAAQDKDAVKESAKKDSDSKE